MPAVVSQIARQGRVAQIVERRIVVNRGTAFSEGLEGEERKEEKERKGGNERECE